jgi:Na+/melibiose symporter-like transporter
MALAKFGKYLQEKSNFIKAGTICFSALFAPAVLWIAGEHGGVGWWLLLVLLSVLAGWAWAVGMWFVLKDDIQRISSTSSAQKINETSSK